MKKSKGKIEQNLIEETAKIYHAIAHDSIDGFWIVDMQGKFYDVNDLYCRMIGYSRSELLEMNVGDVEAKRKPKDIIKQFKQIKQTGTKRFFTQHQKKNNTIIDIEITANYTNHLGGLIFASLRDITGIKRTENDQFRNRAESRKKMEGQLADSYKHSKKEAQSKKVIEGQLADSYEHSENQAKSRKVVEGQLTDSYKHLGTINRKISLLLELEDFPMTKKNSKGIIDHVLNMAMSISNAPTGYLYGSKGRGKFNLLSYKGCDEKQKEKINIITSRKVGLLRHLLSEKNSLAGIYSDMKQNSWYWITS